MKKVMLLVLILLLATGVYAEGVKTRIYGNIDPLTRISLSISYYSQGVKYDQTIFKDSDNLGNWEYKLNSDPVTFEMRVTYKDIIKEFSVFPGPDFEVFLHGKPPEGFVPEEANTSEETTESNVSVTGATAETTTKEITEPLTEEIQGEQESAPITGQASLEEEGEFDFGNLSIYLLIFLLFVTMVIANIVSAAIIGAFKGIGKRRMADSRNIKVTKLSERLAKIKEKEDRIKEEEAKLAEELDKAKSE